MPEQVQMTINQQVKKSASSLAGVTTSVACKGTALEATTFNVNGKAFLFLRPVQGGEELRLKLDASIRDIEKLAEQWPESYSVGANGWAKLIISEQRSLPLVADWIAESYALIGGAKKPAAKKPAAKKPGAKKNPPAKKKR
jgi:predicted DNA-binding protein (MmcQ/YjbR family)